MSNLKLDKEISNKQTIFLGIKAILVLLISIIIYSCLEYYFPNYKTIISFSYYVFNITALFFFFQ